MHFGRLLLLWFLSQSSEVESNPKMSISFFDDLGGPFCILVDFCHSDCSAKSSEVECNPKMRIYFLMTYGAFICISAEFHHSDCSANHQKLNIIQKWAFHFWWLRGLSLHFGWLLLLRLLSQSSEVESNPKMSIWFFDDLGGLFHILVDFCC